MVNLFSEFWVLNFKIDPGTHNNREKWVKTIQRKGMK